MEAPEGTVEVLYPRSEAEAKAKAKAKADAEAEAEQEEKYPPRRRRKAGSTAPATNWRGVVDYQRNPAPSLEAGVEPVPPDVAAKVKGNNFWFNVRALAGCKSSDLRRIANEYAVGSPEQQAADTDNPCRGNALSIVLLGCESYDRLVILNGIIAAALDRQRGTPPFYACATIISPRLSTNTMQGTFPTCSHTGSRRTRRATPSGWRTPSYDSPTCGGSPSTRA